MAARDGDLRCSVGFPALRTGGQAAEMRLRQKVLEDTINVKIGVNLAGQDARQPACSKRKC